MITVETTYYRDQIVGYIPVHDVDQNRLIAPRTCLYLLPYYVLLYSQFIDKNRFGNH